MFSLIMNKCCVCIEGQLRGSNNCGSTIKKYLIEKLNADLYFIIQNFEKYNEENTKHYGLSKIIVYENPLNFANIFDELCDKYNFDKFKWRETFKKVHNSNYKLGYDRPGTCIRRMYNRYLIYNELKDSDYEWFVISRSDYYFVDYFYDLNELKKDCLNLCDSCSWGGLNNNIIIFHKNLFEKVLTYIKIFLKGDFLDYYLNNCNNSCINEENFFMINMIINDVKINFIKNKWFISADNLNEITTWEKIKKSDNNHYYKYKSEYDDCMYYLKNNN